MIASLLGGITASPWARAALRYSATALAIILFLLSIRRSGERVGRVTERFETGERTNETQRRMLEAAARRPCNRGELVDRLRDGRLQSRKTFGALNVSRKMISAGSDRPV